MLKPALLGHVPLDHAWIAAHIPHQGSMCLLDAVLHWDSQHLVCCATSHRQAGNPLRQFDRLGAACGIEYAAQAMAVHGVLVADHGRVPDPNRTPDDDRPTLGRPGGLLVSAPNAAQAPHAPRGGQPTLGRPGGLLVSAPNAAQAPHAPRGGQPTLGRPGGLLVSTPNAAQAPHAPQGGQPTLGRPGGLLVSLRAVQLHVARIDDIPAALEVCVERLSGDARMLLYRFRVATGDRLLLDGRASVVLDAAGPAPSFASTPP